MHCSWGNLHYIWCKFSIISQKINAGTAPSNGAMWDEINEQHDHRSIKKHQIQCPINTFLVHIRCIFNGVEGYKYMINNLYTACDRKVVVLIKSYG